MKLTFLILIIFTFIASGFSQKTLEALRMNKPIKIDGLIDESIWKDAAIANGFTTISPEYGKTPEQKTLVRILYDDDAIYIAAVMEEISRDSIMTELSQRDDFGNTDSFGVMLDTYGNGNDGVFFAVGSTGVQYDALKANNGNEDNDWDAVWMSDVNLTDDGWTCEIMLPYSALRFPKDEMQEWTINFTRRQARKNENVTWSPFDPKINGVFNQSGKLINLKDIKPPIRLSFSPYFSAYALHNHDKNNTPINSTGYTYTGGMDVKYGINDAFTLDMTLIPDFGQVESDDNVINLSPFEVRFAEKRPFFTEGVEMFEKANIFYTRRVGGTPVNFYDAYGDLGDSEIIKNNPQIPQLFNATKVSGRNSKGLGIGVFNAVEAPTYAEIENTETGEIRKYKTQPLTNYNVIVFDQNLKNNSSISFINTNVWRQGLEFYDANVTGYEINLKDKEQKYSLSSQAAYSLQSYNNTDNITGHKFEIEFEKISGNFNYWVGYSEESPDYNPNDLGFLRAANERNFFAGASYSIFEPFGKFNRANFWTNFDYNRIIDPNAYTGIGTNLGFWMQSTGFWEFNMWANYSPENYDYFEPRTPGRYLTTPTIYNTGIYISSDSRKKFRLTFNAFIYNVDEKERWGYEYEMNPRFRFSDKLSMNFSASISNQFDDTGFVDDGDSGEIIMGQRDRFRVRNLLAINYNFTEKIGLNLRTRHYWERGVYSSYHDLSNEGHLGQTNYDLNNDYEGSFFNVDLNFNWRFAPGSDIFINWKNSISGGTDNTMTSIGDIGYFDGLNNLRQYPQNNSISVRVVYYLDYYLNIKKWIKK